MVKTSAGAGLHTGAERNVRHGGSEEGDEGSDEENVDDDAGMAEKGAAMVKVEEISDVSDEDDVGFTKLLPSPLLPTQQMTDLHNISNLLAQFPRPQVEKKVEKSEFQERPQCTTIKSMHMLKEKYVRPGNL